MPYLKIRRVKTALQSMSSIACFPKTFNEIRLALEFSTRQMAVPLLSAAAAARRVCALLQILCVCFLLGTSRALFPATRPPDLQMRLQEAHRIKRVRAVRRLSKKSPLHSSAF